MDDQRKCEACRDSGVVGGPGGGRFCVCPMGNALAAAPRVLIGTQLFIFPPGTTPEEAQAVLDEAARRVVEKLS